MATPEPETIPVREGHRFETSLLEALLSDRTRLVAVTHVSNVSGAVPPVEKIVALAHARGEHVAGLKVTTFVDVAAIRKKTGLSQAEFAKRFGLDLTAVQAWEQKRRMPERAAQVLLRVIDYAPDTVAAAVRKAG